MRSNTDQTRRQFLKTAGSAALAGLFTPILKCGGRTQPNIVLILADDLGWTDVGCYGSTFYETPNIDRLAAQGMIFSDAYAACPVCSPTRAALLTGRYSARLHLTDFLPGRRNMTCQPLLQPDIEPNLLFSETTLAEALKPHGYVTASIGKWHLGEKGSWPRDHGFDVNVAGYEKGFPASYFYPYESDKPFNPRIKNLDGGNPGEYLTDRLTHEAVRFMETHQNEPFFLYLSHYAVHDPLQARPELVEKYKAKLAHSARPDRRPFILEGNPASEFPKFYKRDSLARLIDDPRYDGHGYLPNRLTKIKQIQDNPVYAAMIESLDDSVGAVMQALDELGLTDNTLLIFTSDNGGQASPDTISTSNLPLRGAKGWLYEGGIREPLIIRWPGRVDPGSECSEPVISTDFYPTILDAAGLPLMPQQHRDGFSLSPVLKGERLEREAIYWHWPHYSNHGQQSPGGAVRMGDYKLIEYYENGAVQLFNLKTDMGEQHNLAAEQPDRAQHMLARLRAWRKAVNADMPQPNPDYEQTPENRFERW
ncbi:MAG: sulfatase [candidate division KSB1 bacterium]|nr:sulfatase [candidate division KSB1 bacterium]